MEPRRQCEGDDHHDCDSHTYWLKGLSRCVATLPPGARLCTFYSITLLEDTPPLVKTHLWFRFRCCSFSYHKLVGGRGRLHASRRRGESCVGVSVFPLIRLCLITFLSGDAIACFFFRVTPFLVFLKVWPLLAFPCSFGLAQHVHAVFCTHQRSRAGRDHNFQHLPDADRR